MKAHPKPQSMIGAFVHSKILGQRPKRAAAGREAEVHGKRRERCQDDARIETDSMPDGKIGEE